MSLNYIIDIWMHRLSCEYSLSALSSILLCACVSCAFGS